MNMHRWLAVGIVSTSLSFGKSSSADETRMSNPPLVVAGVSTIVVGSGLLVGGIASMIYGFGARSCKDTTCSEASPELKIAGSVMVPLGAIAVIAGVVMTAIGAKRVHSTVGVANFALDTIGVIEW